MSSSFELLFFPAGLFAFFPSHRPIYSFNLLYSLISHPASSILYINKSDKKCQMISDLYRRIFFYHHRLFFFKEYA
jgi:hypothetical protein